MGALETTSAGISYRTLGWDFFLLRKVSFHQPEEGSAMMDECCMKWTSLPAVVDFNRFQDISSLFSPKLVLTLEFSLLATKPLCETAFSFHCPADLCYTPVSLRRDMCLNANTWRGLWGQLIISCLSKVAGKLKRKSHLTVLIPVSSQMRIHNPFVFHNYSKTRSGSEITSGTFR